MAAHCVIAIDLGGTNIRAALCDGSGAILKRFKQLTHPELGAPAVIHRIAEAARAVLPADRSTDSEQIVAGIGVASPGPIDPYTGTVLYAANLYWHDVALRDALQDALNLPVTVGNDANLAALGEQKYGAGRGVRDLVYITLSTGIGCGVILNDQLVLGHRGLATEIGHMVIDYNAPPGDSGVPGCFEHYAAGPGIARLAQAKARQSQNTKMLELAGGDPSKITAKEVGEAAQSGDPLALEVVHETARIIGLGMVNALHLFDPAMIIVGGSVSLMGEMLFKPVRETIERHAMPPYRGRPLVPAQLGDDCGLLGAAALALQTFAEGEDKNTKHTKGHGEHKKQ
jgi:glucokinase